MMNWFSKLAFWRRKEEPEPFFPIELFFGREGHEKSLLLHTNPCRVEGDYLAFMHHVHDKNTSTKDLSLVDRTIYWLILESWERQRLNAGEPLARQVQRSRSLPNVAKRVQYGYVETPAQAAALRQSTVTIDSLETIQARIKNRMKEVEGMIAPKKVSELTTEQFYEAIDEKSKFEEVPPSPTVNPGSLRARIRVVDRGSIQRKQSA